MKTTRFTTNRTGVTPTVCIAMKKQNKKHYYNLKQKYKTTDDLTTTLLHNAIK